MIVLSFTSNIDQIINTLRRKTDAVIDQIRRGMFEGIRLFEGASLKEFYTGRPGLNVITGTLRRGWLTKTITSYEDFIVQLGNKVKYGPVHEFGYPEKNIPKRTDVIGKFQREGYGYLNKAISNRLSRFIKVSHF